MNLKKAGPSVPPKISALLAEHDDPVVAAFAVLIVGGAHSADAAVQHVAPIALGTISFAFGIVPVFDGLFGGILVPGTEFGVGLFAVVRAGPVGLPVGAVVAVVLGELLCTDFRYMGVVTVPFQRL